MRKSNVLITQQIEEKITIDAEGNETKTTLKTSRKQGRSTEPDYIKIYTEMWCKFNQIPDSFVKLFLALASRMSYCNANDLENSQLVNTCKPWSESIMKECGWNSDVSLKKGLQALCKAGAIKKVGRGVYQINPSYAGKGEWQYNPKLNRGGVEELVAVFDFGKQEVKTDIVWADDGENNDLNETYRMGLDVRPEQEAVLKETKKRTRKKAEVGA